MKMTHYALFILPFLLIIAVGCTDDSGNELTTGTPTSPSGDVEWAIPESQVFDGGPGLDGIPSIDNPEFTTADEVDFLLDDDLVLGIQIGDDIRAYPHPILDWHEIVNDEIGDISLALTYCPLTGTGIGWDRNINGNVTTFGVSGLLYNSNLMPYDRASGSVWSQQRLDCVNGENIGTEADLFVFVETNWSTWIQAYPNSQVMNTNTGIERNYNNYPYGTYRTNSTLLFPVSDSDDSRDRKERVLGVFVEDEVKIYPFLTDDEVVNQDTIIVLEDSFEGTDFVVVQNVGMNYLVAFEATSGRTYTALDSKSFPAVIQDSEGFTYDLLGNGISDPNRSLSLATQFIGYWFSWAAFYPNLDIYEE